MKAYADTSFLVSLYTPDVNSAVASAEAGRAGLILLLTAFGEVELTNAIELRVFRREILRSQAKAAYAALQHDIRTGVLPLYPVPLNMFERAKQVVLKHTAALGIRTLDVLHVAAALTLGVERFYTFDARQRQLAAELGLEVH